MLLRDDVSKVNDVEARLEYDLESMQYVRVSG